MNFGILEEVYFCSGRLERGKGVEGVWEIRVHVRGVAGRWLSAIVRINFARAVAACTLPAPNETRPDQLTIAVSPAPNWSLHADKQQFDLRRRANQWHLPDINHKRSGSVSLKAATLWHKCRVNALIIT